MIMRRNELLNEVAINTNEKKERGIMNRLNKMLAKGYVKLRGGFDDVVSEERGASDLVVLVGLIVITLAVIIIFRGQLTNIINAVGAKVMGWINAN